MKGQGWFKESWRHRLARLGIGTKPYMVGRPSSLMARGAEDIRRGGRKIFSSKPVKPPIQLAVFEDYDELDELAREYNYRDHGEDRNYTGWIATMGDEFHDPERMLEEANQKLLAAQETEDAIIGFAQTGHFSVGYTIYTKPKA